jgi:RecA-family ATPase
VELDLRRFKEERDGTIRAEITLTTTIGSVGRVAGPARLNLLSDRSIKQLANTCKDVTDIPDWYALITHAAATTVEYLRQGTPLELVDLDAPHERQWILNPFLEADGYTVLFARGGSGKSFLAAALALCIATGNNLLGEVHKAGPVAYHDWEASKEEFDSRISRLARAMQTPAPEVWYRKETASLHHIAPTLNNHYAEHGVVAAIIDSKGMALTGSPESAEAVLELTRSIRTLGVPIILIDHVSKGAIKGDDPDMAFGSAYTEYGARLAWKLNPDWKTGSVDLRLKNTKANNGPKADEQIITLTFDGDRVHVSTPQPPIPEPILGDRNILAELAGLPDRRNVHP